MIIESASIVEAIRRVSFALKAQADYLTTLDQAVGDGDLGITLSKIADALLIYIEKAPLSDLGKFLAGAGMETNRAGSSTMGTLLATALMRSGKEVMGKSNLTTFDLIQMFRAAENGVKERGKANLGDKTFLDSFSPACEAFTTSIDSGDSIVDAGTKALAAAKKGLDSVTPLRSRIGRASWVGERTEGKTDPGCAAFIVILKAIIGEPKSCL